MLVTPSEFPQELDKLQNQASHGNIIKRKIVESPGKLLIVIEKKTVFIYDPIFMVIIVHDCVVLPT